MTQQDHPQHPPRDDQEVDVPERPVPTAPVTLVTGASSGIGRATALALAARGHHVVLVARRREQLREVADACRSAGGTADVAPCDVADDGAVAAVVDDVVHRHGRLDAVAHCAGLVTYGRFEETSPDDFATVVDVNLGGSAHVSRHALRVLRRQRHGTLVLVGSLLGHVAVPEMTAYVVSKWGVRALARQLKIENADLPGVRIAYVSPGSVETPIYERALDDGGRRSVAPPPAVSAEVVAAKIVRHLDAPRLGSQTALTNYALIGAFTAVPALYDRLVGPGFRLLSRR
ncbi:SDR family NAD(P)-dependent oxidoreductase [Nocardioides aequoreus]|uniref:SDR family NAD(P)-dependent oxidoreductase n=1 Tax=Nocardioides aequoreus TaxID=397278 RepID=UPI001B802446|nr:SDR family oxidoreductase [Nocardioides aequoreus]